MSIVYINFTLKLPTADAKVKFISKLACSSFEIKFDFINFYKYMF